MSRFIYQLFHADERMTLLELEDYMNKRGFVDHMPDRTCRHHPLLCGCASGDYDEIIQQFFYDIDNPTNNNKVRLGIKLAPKDKEN